MPDVELSLAISYYDHVGDLVRGRVRAEGIALTCIQLPVEEIFFRMISFTEWDIAECSAAKYVSLTAAGVAAFQAIPVFPSRMFRQSAFYVPKGTRISGPLDLVGKRVGIPEWAQTAGIYARGYLQHQCGIALRDIRWVQAGVNTPGRVEKVKLALPEGVEIERVHDRSLNEMLLAGELHAVMSAREPAAFVEGDPRVTRLWPNPQPIEEAYYRESGIFPIMHMVVIKKTVLDRHPWVAMNLFKAFEEAKTNSVREILSVNTSRLPIAWAQQRAMESQELLGEDYWPYGIERNRRTLEAFVQYCHEQGVTDRKMKVEDLFAHELSKSVKV